MIILNIFLKWLLFFFSYSQVVIAVAESKKYEIFVENGKLPLSFAMLLDKSLAECTAVCSQRKAECTAVNHNKADKECELIAHYPPIVSDLVTNLVTNPNDWNVYYTVLPPCSHSSTKLMASGSVRVITSPNYPNDYDHHANIYWLIIKPSKVSTLVMFFRDMNIEDNDCKYDSVSFYRGRCTDDERIAKVCGTGNPTVEDSSSPYVLVYFRTDTYTVKPGFKLEYYIA